MINRLTDFFTGVGILTTILIGGQFLAWLMRKLDYFKSDADKILIKSNGG